MMNNIVLISKDILMPQYLPTYGNTYWKTPNIDELAAKGTVFKRHYTAAPSTAMAFTAMFTGKYPHETGYATYREVQEYDGETLFDRLFENGYQCHLVWSRNYIKMAEKYSKCYGKHTVRHESIILNQSVGAHLAKGPSELTRNDSLLEETYAKLVTEIDAIDRSKPTFLWVHLPHVFLGRVSYGDDIDILDRFVGDMRKRFGDNGIFITADHGNMNGEKGKTCYGFDVYEPAIRIPLIAPRINNVQVIDQATSNTQLSDLILNKSVSFERFIISDSQYYAQPLRRTAVISGNYKLIYNKLEKKTELFDVVYDPHEDNNLLIDYVKDTDRASVVNKGQVVFYPYKAEAMQAYSELREKFDSFWKQADNKTEFTNYWRWKLGNIKGKILDKRKNKAAKSINEGVK